MEEKQECISCRKLKADRQCGLCEGSVCRGCAEFLEEQAFAFLAKRPEELSHSFYCSPCFDSVVAPQRSEYEETLERARQVYVFFSSQKRHIPTLGQAQTEVRVDHCADRDETILRLGFRAAELGFNAIQKVEVTAKKVRNAGYQTSDWCGSGLPVKVDPVRIDRDHSRAG
jgi:hypothetical protein